MQAIKGLAMRKRRSISILILATLTACTFPGVASPTPFTFPTPNQTHTAIFAGTPTDTPVPPTLPALATDTPGQAAPSPTADTLTPEGTSPAATAAASPTRPNGDPVRAVYASTPPTIDGELSEWTSTPYAANETVPLGAEDWTGASDLSATFYVSWDPDYLYVAVRRTDDTFVQISWGRYMYRGDDVEIQIDTDLAVDFDTDGMSSDDYQIGLSPGNFSSIQPEAYRWYPRSLESWINSAAVAAKLTTDGYTLEAKIPWSAFNLSPESGGHYGFALALSDNDLAGTSTWQSMVANVGTRVLNDPTTWGTLILEPPASP
jgi:hypothetical protein